MNIKMVALDLDGTLLRDDKTVSDYTLSVLRKCREKGVKVIYATSRGHSATRLVPGDLFDGFVRMGGAVAYAGDKLLYSRLIPTAEIRGFLIDIDKAGIRFAAELNAWHFANFDVSKEWDWLTYFELADFATLDIEAEKMYALPGNQQETDLIHRLLPAGLRVIPARDENFTMIMHEQATKAKASFALARYWGIDKAEVAAFGDDLVDIDMLEYFGAGVAMGNALDEAKAVADYVCDTNENDGVARWLEENVL